MMEKLHNMTFKPLTFFFVPIMRSRTFFGLVFLCLLSLFSLSVFGQSPQTIQIQTNQSKTFNLSEIAEQIQSVNLEMNQSNQFDRISDVLWTDRYLFISVYSIGINQRLPTRVLQYDHSGKFIREIGDQSIDIRELLCDTVKKLLFVPKGQELLCYDFEGKLKDRYLLKAAPGLYDNGCFWIDYSVPQQNGMHYYLINHELLTAKEDILFDYVDLSAKIQNADLGFNATIGRGKAHFSFRGRTPVVSFRTDDMLHQIEGNMITPIVKFNIEPASTSEFEKYIYPFQGFIGNYLCIHYSRSFQTYLYLKNMSTGKIFQTKYVRSGERTLTDGIKDDMSATGFCDITPLNRPGFFYFIKRREELKDNPNFSDEKAGYTVFFVKLKP